MNILYIAHERNMGGASRCLVDLAEGMKARGHNVYVTVPIRNCHVQKELERRGITVIPVFFVWWEYPSYWKWYLKAPFRVLYAFEGLAVHRIGRIIKMYHIDILHSNSSVIDVGMKASVKYGVRHIWHFREFGDLDYQLEYFHGKKECLEQLNRSGSEAIYISHRVEEHYKDYIDAARTRIIYDGIDLRYCCDRREKLTGKVIFLLAGFLHRNKRQNLAIQAAHILKQRGCNDFEIWIAGQPSAMADSVKYTAELKSMAGDMQEQIRFLGFVEDMIALRKNADVEIVPSAEEAFGRVTVEAMMAQMPVIGSDSGANPEIIVPGETGELFENGNAEMLAEKMQKFVEHRQWISAMGAAGQKRAKALFSLDTDLSQVEELYINCMESSERGHN